MCRWTSLLVLGSVTLVVIGCGSRGTYPDRPITLICPWAAGGGTDRVSRQMAVFLEKELAVPINVVNATGGAGVTGHSRGLRARPDGYTLTMMTVEINMLHWRKLTNISWNESTPLMSINEDAAALFVRSEAPWQNLSDLAAEVRKQPGRLQASGTSTGGIWHLALAGWLTATGMEVSDVKWIPMNGAGPSLQELASGGLDIVSCSLPEARTLYKGGIVRCLGVMSAERVPGYEEVPTFAEQGTDWIMSGWRGLGVPKDTPPEVAEKLVQAIGRIVNGDTVLNNKTFPEFMALEGFNNASRLPAEFRRFLDDLDGKFGKILTSEEFSSVASAPISPMAFPLLLFALLAGLLVALAVQRFVTRNEPKELARTGPSKTALVNASLVVGAVLFYLRFADSLGFVLTSAVVFFVLAWRLGSRLWASAIVTVLFVPAVYQVFAHFLRVPLPRGILGW